MLQAAFPDLCLLSRAQTSSPLFDHRSPLPLHSLLHSLIHHWPSSVLPMLSPHLFPRLLLEKLLHCTALFGLVLINLLNLCLLADPFRERSSRKLSLKTMTTMEKSFSLPLCQTFSPRKNGPAVCLAETAKTLHILLPSLHLLLKLPRGEASVLHRVQAPPWDKRDSYSLSGLQMVKMYANSNLLNHPAPSRKSKTLPLALLPPKLRGLALRCSRNNDLRAPPPRPAPSGYLPSIPRPLVQASHS